MPSHRLNEVIKAPKNLQEGEEATFSNKGEKGLKLDVRVELTDGDFINIRFLVDCNDREVVTSYEAGLCVAGPRVRGLGFSPVAVKRKYKTYIPKGWHENVIDPNLPVGDENHNRHLPLPDFHASDLLGFTRQAAVKWYIDLAFSEDLL